MIDKIERGTIVRSKAGRDKFRYFVVIEVIDESYCLIADGDLRKLEAPKKKKISHLAFTKAKATDIEDFKFTNKSLKALTKSYNNRGNGHLCQKKTL